ATTPTTDVKVSFSSRNIWSITSPAVSGLATIGPTEGGGRAPSQPGAAVEGGGGGGSGPPVVPPGGATGHETGWPPGAPEVPDVPGVPGADGDPDAWSCPPLLPPPPVGSRELSGNCQSLIRFRLQQPTMDQRGWRHRIGAD